MIYDLLVKNSGPLELREDPDQGVQVAGLKRMNVKTAGDIMVGALVHGLSCGIGCACTWTRNHHT